MSTDTTHPPAASGRACRPTRPPQMRKVSMAPNLFIRSRTACGCFGSAVLALLLGFASHAEAQTPSLPAARLYSIYPAGGKQGTTFDVTIAGADLDDARQLQFAEPGISGEPKMGEPALGQTGPQPLPGQFTVTIKPEVKPGIYEARAVGKYGVSNPRAFVVGTQGELLEVEPNNSAKQATEVPLGTTVNGRSD